MLDPAGAVSTAPFLYLAPASLPLVMFFTNGAASPAPQR